MPGFGNTFRKDVNNYIFRNTTLPNAITSLYVSLHTADPGVDGQTANEVSTGGGSLYVRQLRTQGTTDWGAATTADPSVIATATSAVTFPAAGTNWGTITHFGLWNHVSNNAAINFIGAGALTASQAVGIGNIASFAIGALTHSFDSV